MNRILKNWPAVGIIITILLVLIPVSLTAEGVQEYDSATGSASAGSAELLEKIDRLTAQVETLKAEKMDDPFREIDSTPGTGYNPRAKYYEVPEGFPKIDSRVRFIGNLRGTWEEMGYQYGERAGDLIETVYTYSIEHFAGKGLDAEHLIGDIKRYRQQIEWYSPEMLDFMQGISEGAAWNLSESPYAEDMSDFEKILLINLFPDFEFFHPPAEMHAGAGSGNSEAFSTELEHHIAFGGHCTGLALGGNAYGDLESPTKNGETIIVNHCDLSRFVPFGWNCAFVATPSDPEANVFWSIQAAGMVGGVNFSVNDKGVTIGNFFGGQSVDNTFDFGVGVTASQIHALAYADTAEEAIDIMVFGSETYRAETGRKKVLQTGLWSYIVGDSEEVAVLELTPNRHAVRRPGDLGEVGNYVIYANWYGSDHYYDENNVRIDEPIGFEDPEFPERYWTYDWFIKYHMGELDEELVREGMRSTYYYDKETGQRIDLLEGTPLPLYIGVHTISAYWGAALGLDVGGTNHASQVVQYPSGRIKINWTQGRPSEWVGPWQSTDFYGYQK